MKPIESARTNFTYLAPAGMRDCDPMPCTRESDGRVVSVWEPTREERAAIAAGSNIELHVWQQPPPPVGMALSPAPAPPGPAHVRPPAGPRPVG